MMTETEFIKAADEVLSMSYDKLQRHLYREAAACIGQMDGLYSGVPVLRLARIFYAGFSFSNSFWGLRNCSKPRYNEVYFQSD